MSFEYCSIWFMDRYSVYLVEKIGLKLALSSIKIYYNETIIEGSDDD